MPRSDDDNLTGMSHGGPGNDDRANFMGQNKIDNAFDNGPTQADDPDRDTQNDG